MKTLKNQFDRLVKDEQGGEMLEYALIAGLIVVAAIAVIGLVGKQVKATWTKINTDFTSASS
ncbi:MAG: Flp family type IVb pilin [Planctomycetota bacterium]